MRLTNTCNIHKKNKKKKIVFKIYWNSCIYIFLLNFASHPLYDTRFVTSNNMATHTLTGHKCKNNLSFYLLLVFILRNFLLITLYPFFVYVPVMLLFFFFLLIKYFITK